MQEVGQFKGKDTKGEGNGGREMKVSINWSHLFQCSESENIYP